MPELRSINGHTESVGKLQAYLEGKSMSRALATDLINVCDRRPPEFKTWSQEMDITRRAAGNDVPYRGRRPRTFMHYVISPDPRDDVSLEKLRELATKWARRFFGDYEVAIVYHDDNENGILHAHVVVNNTNMSDGHRLTSDLTKERVRDQNLALQRMAQEMGLRAFAGDHESVTSEEMAKQGKHIGTERGSRRARARLAGAPFPEKSNRPRRRRRTTEQHGRGGMDSRAAYVSWKTEIQDRVDVARAISLDESQFKRALAAMGIEVAESRGGDYLFCHPLGGSKKVTGARLGPVYSKAALSRGFELGYVRWLQRSHRPAASAAGVGRAHAVLSEEQIERVASSIRASTAHGVPRDIRAADIARLLDYNGRHGVTGNADYGAGPEARAMAELARKVGIFDSAGRAAQTRRAREDARLVGRWLQEDRSAAGAGGGSYQAGSSSGAEAEERSPDAPNNGGRRVSRASQAH